MEANNHPDRLEDFIRDHREDFDVHEPSPGLWEKILPEEESSTPYTASSSWSVIWKAAAVVAIILSSYAIWQNLQVEQGFTIAGLDTIFGRQEEPKQEDFAAIPELAEAELYYNTQVNTMLNELDAYNDEYPGVKEDVEVDLAELDKVYNELRQDLKEDIANPEIIEAMIQNYRLKLNILKDILEQIKKSNNEYSDEEELPAAS